MLRYCHCATKGYDLCTDMVRTFLERSGSYVSQICNYRKNSQKKGLRSFSKNLRYITAVSLQKLTPDVTGCTAIYFNLHETPQMQSNPPPKSRPDRLFQQLPKYWNRNLYVQNVLVCLESCVGMFWCIILSLKVAAFEPLARGRVKKIIFSQTNQTRTLYI